MMLIKPDVCMFKNLININNTTLSFFSKCRCVALLASAASVFFVFILRFYIVCMVAKSSPYCVIKPMERVVQTSLVGSKNKVSNLCVSLELRGE